MRGVAAQQEQIKSCMSAQCRTARILQGRIKHSLRLAKFLAAESEGYVVLAKFTCGGGPNSGAARRGVHRAGRGMRLAFPCERRRLHAISKKCVHCHDRELGWHQRVQKASLKLTIPVTRLNHIASVGLGGSMFLKVYGGFARIQRLALAVVPCPNRSQLQSKPSNEGSK